VTTGAAVLQVPRAVVEHFGYGTLYFGLDVWSPDDFSEMRELGEAWALAMGGQDPVPITATAIAALDKFAGLLFGYYAHPYRPRRREDPECGLCLATWDVIRSARAA
jgi:hypothetical protein